MMALNISANGMKASQDFVDVTSNNLANTNTTGYKFKIIQFQDLLYQDRRRVGSNSSDNTKVPSGIQLGLGVKTASISSNTSQGTLQSTQNTLDLAIQGKGYFQITMPDGSTAYTRDGALQLSTDGILVNADGFQVQPAITIPTNATSVSISQSGLVSVTTQGQSDATNIGQIQIASFINPSGLLALGNNLLQETASSGTPNLGTPSLDGFGSLSQGFLESSNVSPVNELTNLIKAQRVYEMNSKGISKQDEMLQALNQTV